MPKKAEPWYRSGRGWYATLQGRQIPLNITDPNDREGALAAMRALLERLCASSVAPEKPTAPPSAVRTVESAVADFLRRQKARISPGAYRQYHFALAVHLVRAFGPRVVRTLTAEEVETWADRPAWSDSTRNNNLGAAGTFLKWAGWPLALRRPAKESRGAETVLSDAQFAKVLAAYDGRFGQADFPALLKVLRETGARPQEIARLTVEAVDWPNTCATLREHKTKRHGAGRVIHFSAAAVAILVGQRAKHGTGYLFRTRAGNPYGESIIKTLNQRISKRLGFRVIAYGLGRHSFATKALVSGVPDTVVAALLGHKTTKMVHSNYAHVAEQSRVLKDAVEKVSGAKAD